MSIFSALGLIALLAGSSHAASKCAAAKLKATGRKAYCLLKLDSKQTATGQIQDAVKVQKCRDKFSAAFVKADGGDDCVNTGDAAAIETKVDGFVGDAVSALTPGSPPAASRCQAAKIKAAGKKAKCLLGLESKEAKGGSVDPLKVQACRDKLSAAFEKAEKGTDCTTSGDAPTIEAAVDTFVADADQAITTCVPSLVSDINPGAGDSIPLAFGLFSIAHLTDVNGTLFFEATDGGGSGFELWKSDGTVPGTVLVQDINPGAGDSDVGVLRDVNGTVFFQADDGIHGAELWKSDGTAGGTVMVKDINPGAGGSGPRRLTNVNGTLFFSADDGTTGSELWKSDGTVGGTVLVKDLEPTGPSGPDWITDVNGTLFFLAFRDPNTRSLWKSDGTAAGTVVVTDIDTAFDCAFGQHFIKNVDGTLFLANSSASAGCELWKSDGTAAGTVLVKDINPGPASPFSNPVETGLAVNGTLFLGAIVGNDGQLWKSDGTAAGTVMVKDINPVAGSGPNLTTVGGTLFFSAHDGSTGIELWKSDGTAAGTVLVEDINPGAADGSPQNLRNVNGSLFFQATDGASGVELWRSDGTAAGTVLVKDINPGTSDSNPDELTDVSGRLFFTANDGTRGYELWAIPCGP
jgi:ELWxxDGT repeat protein